MAVQYPTDNDYVYKNLLPVDVSYYDPKTCKITTRWSWKQRFIANYLLQPWNSLIADFKKLGVPLVVSGLFRTYQMQMNTYAAKPNLAVHPGRSWHEAGAAIDVAIEYMMGGISWSRLVSTMNSHGFANLKGITKPTQSEAWHFQCEKFYDAATGKQSKWSVTKAIEWIRQQK